MKKIIVISAINITEGGLLTILKDCLSYASTHLTDTFDIIALVHQRTLADFPGIRYLEFPLSKKSWFFRLFYEYFYFYFLSKKLKADVWLSLHDMTPHVVAPLKAVYCHNATPFYKTRWRDLYFDPKLFLFAHFYRYLYKINIHKNDWVIVQQHWIKTAFEAMYHLNSVVVCRPMIPSSSTPHLANTGIKNHSYQFLYVSYPRPFKNFEMICQAVELLEQKGRKDFSVTLTLAENDNRYARYIYQRFKHLKTLRFMGIQPPETIASLYAQANCLIFPSKLETWGLPITEFTHYQKPILLIDLPYAHETIADYPQQYFFKPDDLFQLVALMEQAMAQQLPPSPILSGGYTPCSSLVGWESLFQLMGGSATSYTSHN